MKRRIRNQLLELLQTVSSGIKQTKVMTPQAAHIVLDDCLAAVQAIGQILEESLAPDKAAPYAAPLLAIKMLLGQAKNETAISGNTEKRMQVELKHVRKLLLKERVKLEAAFIPYKASMWDSLESIWRAADADPACDAYVVPIPYFDKRPDGTLGSMHCEAGLYPGDVPVIDWNTYSPSARRPDLIFIHNPYDGENLVTSVHPDFYSQLLKDCTDMLVYVPYFIQSISNDKATDHFCITPGCVYAHRTILQSKKMREDYIRVYQEVFGNRFGNPEKKFLALGSPKIDKICGMKREDFPLPDAWRRLCAEKKILLYNTSIGNLLQNPAQYLAKIRNVFQAVQEHRDVVLWWRPHPLLKSTIASMIPALAQEYQEILVEYTQKAYGILDDSPDLYRALTWCDAYYGDGSSSLLSLWFITGKPLLIQDARFLSAPNKNEANTAQLLDTSFTTARGYRDIIENNGFPELNLYNLLTALAAGRLRPFTEGALSEMIQFEHPEGDAGQAIYERMKREVLAI